MVCPINPSFPHSREEHSPFRKGDCPLKPLDHISASLTPGQQEGRIEKAELLKNSQVQSFAGRVANCVSSGFSWLGSTWLGSKATSGASWLSAKTVENAFFRVSEVLKERDQALHELEEMSSGKELGLFLSQLSYAISDVLRVKASGHGMIASMVENDGGFLGDLIHCLVLKMAVNVGKDLKARNGPVSLTDLVIHFGLTLQELVKNLQENLAKAHEMEDETARTQAVNQAVDGAAESILRVLLPKGGQDLPLRAGFKNVFWNLLKSKGVSSILLELARFSGDLKAFSKIDQLKNDPNQAILKDIVEASSALSLKQANHLGQAEVADAYADAILNMLPCTTSGSEEDLSRWLSRELQSLSKNENPLVQKLKNRFSMSIEALLSHALVQLSKTTSSDPSDDPLEVIFEKIVHIAVRFHEARKKAIDDTFKKLIAKNIDPTTHLDYIECFKPLALELMESCGLQHFNALLPKTLKPLMQSLESEYLPKLLARHYNSLIVPALQLYDEVTNPLDLSSCKDLKLLKGGELLAKQGTQASSLIVHQLPNYLSVHREEVATVISKEVALLAKKLDREIRKAINPNLDSKGLSPQHSMEFEQSLAFVKPWVAKKLEKLSSSQDLKVLNIWKFLASQTDKVFAHSVRAIYKSRLGLDAEKSKKASIFSGAVDEILSVIDAYIKAHGSALKELVEKDSLNPDPKADDELHALLLPLSESLYQTLGLHDTANLPIPEILKPFVRDLFLSTLTSWLAQQYLESRRLNDYFNDSKANLMEIFQAVDPNKAAAEVEFVGHLSGLLSDKISDSLIRQLSKYLQGECATSPAVSIEMEQFNDQYIKAIVKQLIFLAMVNYLSGVKAEPLSSEEGRGIVSGGIMKLGLMLQNHLSMAAEEIGRADAIKDLEVKKAAILKAMTPLSSELLKLFSLTDTGLLVPLDAPFQTPFKVLWELLGTKVLPDFLADLYLDRKSWQELLKVDQRAVLAMPNGKYIPESCRVIAQWVGSFLPVYLHREPDLIAETVLNAAKKYLKESGNADGLSIEEYLTQNEAVIKERLIWDVFPHLTEGSALVEKGKPVAEDYLEFLLVRFFEGLSLRVAEKEQNPDGQGEFLVNLAIKFLSIANSHFKTINKVAGERRAYTVDHNEYLKGFTSNENTELHPGVPKSSASASADQKILSAIRILDKERARYAKLKSQTEKAKCMKNIRAAQKMLREAKAIQNEERQAFFKPLTENLLEIAGIAKPEDFPFPEPMREEVFALLKSTLLPSVLDQIYELILEPATINAMMTSGLIALNESLDNADSIPTEVPKDEKQQKLNKVCGELILELLQQIPESYTRIVLKIDKLKQFTTEAVGEAVRRQAGENLTLAGIIEKGLMSGIPILRSGKWDLVEGKVRFSPGQWVDVEGKKQFVEDPDVSGGRSIQFPFAMTDDELEAEERRKIRENKRAEEIMKNMMVKTTHRLTSDAFFYSLKVPVIYFLKIWNKAVDYVFGKYAPQVRELIKYDGKKLIFRLLEMIFSLIYKGVTFIPWFFIDWHNEKKAEAVIRNMHLKIHENLLVGLSNELMAALCNKDQTGAENTFESIIKAAEMRDQEAEKERQAYLKTWGIEA